MGQTPGGGQAPGGGQIPPGAVGQGQPGQGQAGQGPSEEEVRQYLSQMRGAPVEQILAEVLSALLNGAQVKLGRKDGRLLIDLAGTLTEQARPHLSEQVTEQVDEALSQLRLSQVQAEKELAEAAADGEGVAETNDLGDTPPKPTQERAEQQAESGAEGSSASAASKLWTPGQ